MWKAEGGMKQQDKQKSGFYLVAGGMGSRSGEGFLGSWGLKVRTSVETDDQTWNEDRKSSKGESVHITGRHLPTESLAGRLPSAYGTPATLSVPLWL